MKKIFSVFLALIMCSAFIVGANAAVYFGEGGIEIDTFDGIETYDYAYEDDGTSYWYEWELPEDYGFGEIEFSIYYGAFDWQGEQYCEGPEDYPAMLDYLRESYQNYGIVTDCTIDGYPAVVVEYDDSSAEIFIRGNKYFYCINLLGFEDSMTLEGVIESVKEMELNDEEGTIPPVTAEPDEIIESEDASTAPAVNLVVRNIIIVAVIAVIAILCGITVGVVVIVIVKSKKK